MSRTIKKIKKSFLTQLGWLSSVCILLAIISLIAFQPTLEAGKGHKKGEACSTKPIPALSEANFNSSIKDGVVLVEFTTAWCSACKKMKTHSQALYQKNESVVKMYSVNFDKNKKLVKKYKVGSVPTMIAFVKGKEVKRLKGFNGKESSIQLLVDYAIKQAKN